MALAPGGGPTPPLRPLALIVTPLMIAGLLWASAGWSGWVPLVGALAAAGVTAALAPAWRGWLALVPERTPTLEATTRRWLPRAGVALLVVAVGLVWLRLLPA